ncbi:MAG: HlyD family efflux transporter periplasmic adaptor subunit [Chloroflexota bacterium]
MKKYGLAITILMIILLVTLPLISCKKSTSTAASTQTTTVKRGDITIDVTGTGNLALSHTEDLAFEMAGTVTDVLVQAGDSVETGQELAKLDTSDWDTQLKTLERQLITAQRSLNSKTNAVAAAQRNITTKELALRSAQFNLQSAQDDINQIPIVKAANDAVENAKFQLQYIQMVNAGTWGAAPPPGGPSFFDETAAQLQLTQAEQNLKDILNGMGQQVSSDVALQIAQMQLQADQSQASLVTAQVALDDARAAVADVELDQELAQQDLADAQEALDEAKAASPVVKATFGGFVTKVNVKGGDEIKKGTVAVQIADPTKFEANILVSERDIFSVQTGGSATVQADALSGLIFPATVSSVAPTATIQSGVVNYAVTVEVQPLSFGSGNQTGQSSANLTRPGSGDQPGQSSTNQTGLSQGFQSLFGGQATPTTTPAVQLRQGLSVTVNILVLQKTDILLVPNRAITRQGRNTVVQVLRNGVQETQIIETGVSDLSNTEVTSGLSEGEEIVLPQVTTTTSTTQQQGGGTFRLPVGGFGR